MEPLCNGRVLNVCWALQSLDKCKSVVTRALVWHHRLLEVLESKVASVPRYCCFHACAMSGTYL